jgi:hypothetical protein
VADVVPVLVAFHSVHWIRVAVESYLHHFPGERILVVDNNPPRGERGWFPHCEEERDWLAAHPGVLVVDGPKGPQDRLADGRPEHGAGLDAALAWCRRNGARVLLHFEPDCLVSGRGWRDNLLDALDRGAWMAGGCRQSHGATHPTPTAWRVDEVRASFRIRPWAEDQPRPAFAELVDVTRLRTDPSREAWWIRVTGYWDTGHKAWFEAAVRGRAALVPTPGFRHYWGGSLALRFSAKTLAERFPEVGPYLELARSRQAVLPVERCPFREDVRDAEGSEVATCRLVQRLSGVTDAGWCAVSRDVCRACCSSFRPSAARPNPAVASVLYDLAERVAARGGVPGCTAAEAVALLERAEGDLGLDLP